MQAKCNSLYTTKRGKQHSTGKIYEFVLHLLQNACPACSSRLIFDFGYLTNFKYQLLLVDFTVTLTGGGCTVGA